MDKARLGSLGMFAGGLNNLSAAVQREVAAELEELGYGALWYGEALARESFTQAAIYLSATSRIVVASGIASIYARDPTAMAFGARGLAEAWDGRFLLGLGVSHASLVERRGHDYSKPLTAMREYLDAMDRAEPLWRGPAMQPAPRVLAALRPRMLALARDRTLGAHPYFVPVEHSRRARRLLGPAPLLAPEQALVLADSRAEARRIGDRHTRIYLVLPNYRNNLLDLGWREADLEPPGSDALFDAVIAWGGVEEVGRRVREHHEAGADHVVLHLLTADPSVPYVAEARALAALGED